MFRPGLSDLSAAAAAATSPSLIAAMKLNNGGVDPLGLRQINFDLMDRVFPGVNNVVRHIRPFTVIAWAWRRAAKCAQERGDRLVPVSDLMDFVDRIEVVYAWSQFLRNRNAALPGREVIRPLILGTAYTFGGEDWRRRRDGRRFSTALSAPINYGPAIKALGWIVPDQDRSGAFMPTSLLDGALAAFDSRLAPYLAAPVFSEFGTVTVTTATAQSLAEAWALDDPSEAEREAMAASFVGPDALGARKRGAQLIIAAYEQVGSGTGADALRTCMYVLPSLTSSPELGPVAATWRVLQVRQAFRLALEALFHWTLWQIEDGPLPTAQLVARLNADTDDYATTAAWFETAAAAESDPVLLRQRLDHCLADEQWAGLTEAIKATLAGCLAITASDPGNEQHDRLPLARAAQEAALWADAPPSVLLTHIFESWIFGQHAYWAVGRGLADARAGGKTLLRLKVVLEEAGWTLTPGSSCTVPHATEDRLETVASLLREARLM